MRHRLIRLLLEDAEGAGDPDAEGAPGERVGLSDECLLDLAVEHQFGSLATSFPGSGAPLELRRLAWWGSALADIGCAAGARSCDEDLMADAARFYLGVALFDDVVDLAPARAAALARPLEPSRLRRKLERPSDPEARLRSDAPDLSLIVALFDKALAGVGRRLAEQPAWRDEVADMLEAMYRSELSLSDDPLAAKTLPFALIGHLALAPGAAAPRAFFAELSSLLGLWDDWQDLLTDGWGLAPNAHLGPPPPGKLRGLGRGLWLTLTGRPSRRIMRALTATLESARPLPPAARRKASVLLLQMLGGPAGAALSGSPPGAPAPPAS